MATGRKQGFVTGKKRDGNREEARLCGRAAGVRARARAPRQAVLEVQLRGAAHDEQGAVLEPRTLNTRGFLGC